jgi:hypothetical protein
MGDACDRLGGVAGLSLTAVGELGDAGRRKGEERGELREDLKVDCHGYQHRHELRRLKLTMVADQDAVEQLEITIWYTHSCGTVACPCSGSSVVRVVESLSRESNHTGFHVDVASPSHANWSD